MNQKEGFFQVQKPVREGNIFPSYKSEKGNDYSESKSIGQLKRIEEQTPESEIRNGAKALRDRSFLGASRLNLLFTKLNK